VHFVTTFYAGMGMQVGMQQPMGMMGGFQPTGMMDPSMGLSLVWRKIGSQISAQAVWQ